MSSATRRADETGSLSAGFVQNNRHDLKANGLVKAFDKRPVVRGISIALKQGEIVGLLGPNGAGKTTTFRMITGEIDLDEGEIWFDGIEISHWPMYRRARLGMAYLPQEPSAFRGLTTEENVIALLEMNGYSKQQIRERLEGLLAEFDMVERRRIKARDLSGGERRRLELMRAMALQPAFVMLDEPLYRHNTEATQEFVPNIDAAIVVLSADLPITHTEYEFLDDVLEHAGKLFFVLNKIDVMTQAEMQDAFSYTEKALDAKIKTREFTIIPISARLGLEAALKGDSAAIDRSGVGKLKSTIESFAQTERHSVLRQRSEDRIDRLVAEARFAVELELKAVMTGGRQMSRSLSRSMKQSS